ncbi:CAAX protease self-immunity [Saccharopolyspora antimicrobica]|uniref:CAAX prenyl protease-like protein n=1 Tax=Saccharopolyspora antimicrobica TaxID=455193 RepID=A0A1I5B8R8_9PSEU|nr:CPBP family intramembrane glutamic endopeptidase [Saccharopolyspora antimicrobica]RKT86501.1 CAAX prenyl protease-like protein [Saccharopolyspora antimicrobica]SFN70919.1 CAAX protease self-immunity [Saccharopolyspora antimicrobica]
MVNRVQTGRVVGLRSLIGRYQLTSFFVLALGLSWIAWTPYVLSKNGIGAEDFEFPEVLGTSQFLGMLPGAYLGPICAAFIVTAVAGGRPGLRRWAGRLLRWRVNWKWYVLAVVGVPVALIIGSIPFAGLENMAVPPAMVLVSIVPGLVLQVLTTGIAEEPGWRDFALPLMQPRFGPLLGTVLLGVIWGIWHLPLFLTEWGGYPNVTWVDPVEFTISCIAISIVMTWVFNRTGESLPIALLLHGSINNFFSIAWGFIFPTLGDSHRASAHIILVVFGAAACVLLVTTRGRLGYKPSDVETDTPDATMRASA